MIADANGGVIAKAMITLLSGVATVFTPDLAEAILGVNFKVLVACALGAYSGFSFGDRIASRAEMYKLFLACLIMGAAWTGMLDAAVRNLTSWELTPGSKAGMGAIVSCLTRFIMPALIEQIRPWIKSIRIPFFSKKDEP